MIFSTFSLELSQPQAAEYGYSFGKMGESMGKLLFFGGSVAMVTTFVIALIQYHKLKRMELTVMLFMLSLAVMATGVTISALHGEFQRQEELQLTRAIEEAEARRQPQEPPVYEMRISWDDSIYGNKPEPPVAPEEPEAEDTAAPEEQPGEENTAT